MIYFVKCKFANVLHDGTPAVSKARFESRDKAFEYAATALDEGATSVTIRPEAK